MTAVIHQVCRTKIRRGLRAGVWQPAQPGSRLECIGNDALPLVLGQVGELIHNVFCLEGHGVRTSFMAKFLPLKKPFRPVPLRKADSGDAQFLSRLFGILIMPEIVIFLAGMVALFVFASVFLNFRVSVFMSNFGL